MESFKEAENMKYPKIVSGLFLITAFASRIVGAQTSLPPFAGWTDSCAYPITIPLIDAPEISRLLEAEAMLIPAGQISRRSDNPSYYRFNNTGPFTHWGNSVPMCPGSKFLGETMMASQGRSGFLVAPDIIATASHSLTFDPSAFAVVFNVRAGPRRPNVCAPPDPEYIHEDNVYFPRLIDPLVTNGMAQYNDVLVDYAAFRLDRPVAGNRRFLRLRRDSQVVASDTLAMAAHPKRLRTKFEYGIKYLRDKPTQNRPYSYHSFANFNIYEGSSGAAAYNLTRGFAEASIGNIFGSGCTIAKYENEGTPSMCVAVHDGCHESWSDDELTQPGDQVNAAPITMFSAHVPTPELRVSPLADVTHVLDLGQAPLPSTYTATASPDAPAATLVTMDVVIDPVPMLQVTPFSQLLNPGISTSFNVTPFVPPGTACGVYDRQVKVTDLTNGFVDILRHRFEIGLTEVEISSAGPTHFQAVVPPSIPAAITFTLANKRPTAVTIYATTTQSWLKIGAASISPPGAPITLASAGTSGDTQTISATIDPVSFGALANGSHQADVIFTDGSTCAVSSEQRKTITLEKGKLRFESYVNELIPSPTPPNQPFTRTFLIPEAFCITNVELSLKTFTNAFVGRDLDLWVKRLWLSINKQNGIDIRDLGLWMENPLPMGWVVPESSEYDLNFKSLLIQTSGNVAPFGMGLDYFTGLNSLGAWSVQIRDIGDLNPGTEAAVHSIYLDIEGVPGICPN